MRIFDNLLGNYHCHNVIRGKINKNCLGNYTNLHSRFNVNLKYRSSLSITLFEELGQTVFNYATKYDKFGSILKSDKSIPYQESKFVEIIRDAIFIDVCIATNILNKGLTGKQRQISTFCRENFTLHVERRQDYKCLPITNNIIGFKINPRRVDEVVLKTNVGLTKVLQQQQASACSVLSEINDCNDLDSILTYLKANASKSSPLHKYDSYEEIIEWMEFPRHYALLVKLDACSCLEFKRPEPSNSWKAIGDFMQYSIKNENKNDENETNITSSINETTTYTNYEIGLDSDGLDQYTVAFNTLHNIHFLDPISDPTNYPIDPFLNKDLEANGFDYTSDVIANKYINFIYNVTVVSGTVSKNKDSIYELLDTGYIYNVASKRQREVMYSLALGVELDSPLASYSGGTGNQPPSNTPKQPSGEGPSKGSEPNGPINGQGQSGPNPGPSTESTSESSSISDLGESSNSMDIQSFALGENILQETLAEAISDGSLTPEESQSVITKIANKVGKLGVSSVKFAAPIAIRQAINALTSSGEIPRTVQHNYNTNYSLVNHMDAEFSAVKASLGLGYRPK